MSEHPPTDSWEQLHHHLVDEHGQDYKAIQHLRYRATERREAADQLHEALHEAEAAEQ